MGVHSTTDAVGFSIAGTIVSCHVRIRKPMLNVFGIEYLVMSNLLSIPFQKAYSVEIKEASRAYISDYSGVHPEEFREDINTWQELRKDAINDTVHGNRVNAMLL